MKIFGFVKKAHFIGLTISCISMINQECKIRPQVVNVNGNEPVFFKFSIVAVVIILTIHMQKFVFPML